MGIKLFNGHGLALKQIVIEMQLAAELVSQFNVRKIIGSPVVFIGGRRGGAKRNKNGGRKNHGGYAGKAYPTLRSHRTAPFTVHSDLRQSQRAVPRCPFTRCLAREWATQTVCRSFLTPLRPAPLGGREDFIRRDERHALRSADGRRERRQERSAQSLRLPAHQHGV